VRSWPGAQVFRTHAVARKSTAKLKAGAPIDVWLVPFADAGGTGSGYKVWLPVGRSSAGGNLLLDGSESRSRPGNLDGSINDENAQSVVVTFDGKSASEDWYAVTLNEPASIKRIVFTHGRSFHDGGWFDVTAGKPVVQLQVAKDGPWITVGKLEDYPATTQTADAGIKPGQRFSLQLAAPRRAVAVRIVGTPSCGDYRTQAFSSCAELEAFAE
jgi:hypothetical protein